jgi:hypothetical protein
VIYPELKPIVWQGLVGGDEDTSAAITARDRKLAAAANHASVGLPLARRLEASGALFVATSQILATEPYAARWYLDLAGLTGKLISKLKASYRATGLTISPETIAANREAGRLVAPHQLVAFAEWINEKLAELYPEQARTFDLAATTTLALAGARIDGRVRNMAGDDAVLILKRLLVGAFAERGAAIQVAHEQGAWAEYSDTTDLTEQRFLRFGGRLVCEFVAGGNRPDIKVSVDGIVIAQGEVKGRTDLSNLWESWMPQINGHLQTWAADISMARRLFFGTIITPEMIDGVTKGGTRHTGLKAFAASGLLSAAYNLTNTVEGEPAALAAFDDLIEQLNRNLT